MAANTSSTTNRSIFSFFCAKLLTKATMIGTYQTVDYAIQNNMHYIFEQLWLIRDPISITRWFLSFHIVPVALHSPHKPAIRNTRQEKIPSTNIHTEITCLYLHVFVYLFVRLDFCQSVNIHCIFDSRVTRINMSIQITSRSVLLIFWTLFKEKLALFPFLPLLHSIKQTRHFIKILSCLFFIVNSYCFKWRILYCIVNLTMYNVQVNLNKCSALFCSVNTCC